MEICVDLNGFLKDGRFICKEIAFASMGKSVLDCFVFETPDHLREYSRDNAWITIREQSFPFSEGDVPYNKIRSICERVAERSFNFFVVGPEKAAYLKQIMPNDVRVETLDFLPGLLDSSYSNQPSCIRNHRNCALQNVLKMRDYILKYNAKNGIYVSYH